MERHLPTEKKKESTALERLSQSKLLTAVKELRMNEASLMLPTNPKEVFAQPKVFEMVKAIGEAPVLSQIEFELVRLSELMTVGGNLNITLITFIARQLVELYPNESIADFKLCFERGAIGHYGNIQRMDGITIRGWMEQYLESKYEQHERHLINSKKSEKTEIEIIADDETANKYIQEMLTNFSDSKPVIGITDEEIKKEGRERPAKKEYKPTDQSYLRLAELKAEYGRTHCDIYTGKKKEGSPTFEDWIASQL